MRSFAFLLSAILSAAGCTRTEETRNTALEAPGEMNAEQPDPAGWKTFLRLGIFEEREDGTIARTAALQRAAVENILRRHADRDNAGALIRGKAPKDGNGVTLG